MDLLDDSTRRNIFMSKIIGDNNFVNKRSRTSGCQIAKLGRLYEKLLSGGRYAPRISGLGLDPSGLGLRTLDGRMGVGIPDDRMGLENPDGALCSGIPDGEVAQGFLLGQLSMLSWLELVRVSFGLCFGVR